MNTFSSSLIPVVPKLAVRGDDLEIRKLKLKPGTEACLPLPAVTRDGTWDGTWASGFFQSPTGNERAANRPVPEFPARGWRLRLPSWLGLGGRSSRQREA